MLPNPSATGLLDVLSEKDEMMESALSLSLVMNVVFYCSPLRSGPEHEEELADGLNRVSCSLLASKSSSDFR